MNDTSQSCVTSFSQEGVLILSTVLDRIRTREEEFTDSERVVARWLEANVNQLAFKPAGFIAQQCGVSESTVVRFARKLGYENYPAVQRHMQNAVEEQLSLRQKLVKSRATTRSDQVLHRVFTTEMKNLKHTLQLVNPNDFQQAVQSLVEAENIGIIGLRASEAPANLLAFHFNLIRPRVRLIGHASADLCEHLLDFGPKDVVILTSVVRAAKRTVAAAKWCARRGIPTIGITDSHYAPLEGYTDRCLKVSADGVFWESYLGVFALCNALIAGVGLSLSASAESRLRTLEEANGIGPSQYEEE